jgi:hypothetical protein
MKSPTIVGFDQHASTRAAAVLWPAQRAVVRKMMDHHHRRPTKTLTPKARSANSYLHLASCIDPLS